MPARKGGHEIFAGIGKTGVDKRCDERYNLSCICGRSSSGRARPCQGRGSEFEPRRPLQKEKPPFGWFFFLECRGQDGTRCLDQRAARQIKRSGRAPANGSAIRGMPVASRASSILLRRARKIKENHPLGGFSLSKKPVIASQSADWRGNPFLKRIIPALFRRFPAKRLRIPTPVTSVTGSE